MGNKFRTTLGLCVGSVMNCADNSGAKNLYIISVKGIKGRLNKIPGATVGNMVMATVKKGKPELRKKGEHRPTAPHAESAAPALRHSGAVWDADSERRSSLCGRSCAEP
tara:strand:+ start:144 stop:470 length:327 start_codon:yes stop_codon:yes gene_type:complete